MSLPSVADICRHPLTADDLAVRFFGGAKIQVMATGVPSPGAAATRLLNAINAALAPIMPVLNIIDALISAVKVFKAVKSLNPLQIGEALVAFIADVEDLASILPPIAGAVFLKDVLAAILAFLLGLREELLALQEANLNATAGSAHAASLTSTFAALGVPLPPGVAGLLDAVTCANENSALLLASIQGRAKPLNRLLQTINLVASIAGLPEIPSLDIGGDLEAAIQAIDAIRLVLQAIENVIPG